MNISTVFCALGIVFVLAIAALHGSGYGYLTEQMNQTNASDFLKEIFPVLFIMPSLYLSLLAAFGVLAIAKPQARRMICFMLAPAVMIAGALALMLGEWLPLIVMMAGGGVFLAAALTAPSTNVTEPSA